MNDKLIFILKICISVLIGYIIGRERKSQNQNGGSRTFAIVSLSACLITILSLSVAENYKYDFMRLLSYGLAGIGFIGSGCILKDDVNIKGLTTASTLFCLLPINYFIGLGYYFYGIFSTILIYIILDSKYWRKK